MEGTKWCTALRRMKASVAAIRCHHKEFDAEMKNLLSYMDNEDVVVAYAAKEELYQVLTGDYTTENTCANQIIK